MFKRSCIIMIIVWLSLVFYGPVFAEKKEPVRLGYVKWSSEIASTTLVKAVLQEEMGVKCITIPMKADEMWKAVADGEVDAMVAAWLPGTHGHYYKKYKENIDDLGPNLKGTKIGLVVPKVTVGRQTGRTGIVNNPYITAKSIYDLKKNADKFHFKIIGIDAEAGIMKKTLEAMDIYGLKKFRLISGSESVMTKALEEAVKKQKWIVITGWVPHWMFGRWNLEFLEDPENVFGGEEYIHTIARKGLKKDRPKVYKFLDNFYWTPEEMEQMMVWIYDDQGQFPYEKALRWMHFNKQRFNSWLD